jgi:hypothetical protein
MGDKGEHLGWGIKENSGGGEYFFLNATKYSHPPQQ